jgi:pimeloyl-ACP methyl ester carboxylesterase
MSAAAAMTVLKQALKRGFASSPDDEVLEGLLAPYSTEVGKLSLIRNAAALNTNLTTEITPLLPRISVPVLILWGGEDAFQVVKYGERLVRDIPEARLVRIDDARHFVMLDQQDRVASEVCSFLAA